MNKLQNIFTKKVLKDTILLNFFRRTFGRTNIDFSGGGEKYETFEMDTKAKGQWK